jgi:hypothetical protein
MFLKNNKIELNAIQAINTGSQSFIKKVSQTAQVSPDERQ